MQFRTGRLGKGFNVGIDYEPTYNCKGTHHWLTIWLLLWYIEIGWGPVTDE